MGIQANSSALEYANDSVAQSRELKEEESMTCHDNRVAICQSESELVSVTEQKQWCDGRFVTKKVCMTWPDGRWKCTAFDKANTPLSVFDIATQWIRFEFGT